MFLNTKKETPPEMLVKEEIQFECGVTLLDANINYLANLFCITVSQEPKILDIESLIKFKVNLSNPIPNFET